MNRLSARSFRLNSLCVPLLSCAVLGLFACLPHVAHAMNATWSGAAGNGGLWATPGNWAGGPAAVPGPGDTATFDNTAKSAGVIDLGSGVTIKTLIFNNSACPSYTLGAGAVNSQTLTLIGEKDCFGGTGMADNSTLTFNASLLFAGASPRIYISGGPRAFVVNGNVTTLASGGTAMLRIIGGKPNTFNGVISDGANAKLALSPGNATTVTLTNPGNTFTGGIHVDNAVLSVNSIGLIGSPSAAGADGILLLGSSFGYGELRFTGIGDFTTDRVVNMTNGFFGAIINQSGPRGHLKFTADMTAPPAGSPTLKLRGATGGSGEISGKIVDNGTIGATALKPPASPGATSLQLYSVDGIAVGAPVSGSPMIPAGTTVTAINTDTKTITLSAATTGPVREPAISVDGLVNITRVAKLDSGTWALSGANTYTGPTTVGDGKLALSGSILGSSAVTVSGGTLEIAGVQCLSDEGSVSISGSGKVQLDTGVKETVGSLVINGVAQDGGIWGRPGHPDATKTSAVFTGDGLLYVGIPTAKASNMIFGRSESIDPTGTCDSIPPALRW